MFHIPGRLGNSFCYRLGSPRSSCSDAVVGGRGFLGHALKVNAWEGKGQKQYDTGRRRAAVQSQGQPRLMMQGSEDERAL